MAKGKKKTTGKKSASKPETQTANLPVILEKPQPPAPLQTQVTLNDEHMIRSGMAVAKRTYKEQLEASTAIEEQLQKEIHVLLEQAQEELGLCAQAFVEKLPAETVCDALKLLGFKYVGVNVSCDLPNKVNNRYGKYQLNVLFYETDNKGKQNGANILARPFQSATPATVTKILRARDKKAADLFMQQKVTAHWSEELDGVEDKRDEYYLALATKIAGLDPDVQATLDHVTGTIQDTIVKDAEKVFAKIRAEAGK